MTTGIHADERERLKKKRWIQTYPQGKQFFPLTPDPSDVGIMDIARALSMKCRYTGHVKHFYSVAQHCLLVSSILPSSFKLAGLLHDATEAYLPDIASPIKSKVFVEKQEYDGGPIFYESFSDHESVVADVIFQGLGLNSIRPLIDSEEVKQADLILLASEHPYLHEGYEPDSWNLPFEANPNVVITKEDPASVERRFLDMFRQLTQP